MGGERPGKDKGQSQNHSGGTSSSGPSANSAPVSGQDSRHPGEDPRYQELMKDWLEHQKMFEAKLALYAKEIQLCEEGIKTRAWYMRNLKSAKQELDES